MLTFPARVLEASLPEALLFEILDIFIALNSLFIHLNPVADTVTMVTLCLCSPGATKKNSFLREAPASLPGSICWSWKPGTNSWVTLIFWELCPMSTTHQGVMDGNRCVSLYSLRSTHQKDIKQRPGGIVLKGDKPENREVRGVFTHKASLTPGKQRERSSVACVTAGNDSPSWISKTVNMFNKKQSLNCKCRLALVSSTYLITGREEYISSVAPAQTWWSVLVAGHWACHLHH